MRNHLLHRFSQWFLAVGSAAAVGLAGTDLFAAEAGQPVFSAEEYAYVRTLHDAMSKRKWRTAGLPMRLAIWRSMVNAYEPGQDPISARYIVTAYGGVIDLRHFLYTASKVLVGSNNDQYWKGLGKPIEPRYAKYQYRSPFVRRFPGIDFHIQLALYDTYCVERGREYGIAMKYEKPEALAELVEGKYWEATPEDLPSSALGAEFARRLLKARDPLTVSIELEMAAFLAPFKPAPDKLREKVSHAEVVFGIPHGSAEKIAPEKLVWFTALPGNSTKLLKAKAAEIGMADFCEEVADSKAALAKAGYEVAKIGGGLPLRIVPIK